MGPVGATLLPLSLYPGALDDVEDDVFELSTFELEELPPAAPSITLTLASELVSSVKFAIFRCFGSLNWFRISRLRRPSTGVSTVRKTAL